MQLIFLHIRRRRGALWRLRRRQKVWQVKTLSNDRWLEAYILSSFAFHIFDPDLTIALTSDYFRVGYNTLGAKCLWSCVKICSDLFDDTTPTTDNDDGGKVVLEDWAVTASHLMLAFIFSITPFLYQSSSVCYAHSQMQKRSMVYLFWTMGYSDQAVRNKTFNSN